MKVYTTANKKKKPQQAVKQEYENELKIQELKAFFFIKIFTITNIIKENKRIFIIVETVRNTNPAPNTNDPISGIYSFCAKNGCINIRLTIPSISFFVNENDPSNEESGNARTSLPSTFLTYIILSVTTIGACSNVTSLIPWIFLSDSNKINGVCCFPESINDVGICTVYGRGLLIASFPPCRSSLRSAGYTVPAFWITCLRLNFHANILMTHARTKAISASSAIKYLNEKENGARTTS